MFIIPTWLFEREKIATMIPTLDIKTIEMILSRKVKFYKFRYDTSTWRDAFTAELLYWFSNKIELIPKRKLRDSNFIDDFDHWKTYYEQYVRILYYFVVYKNIRDSDELRKIFSYLFSVDKNDNPYRNSYDMISAEKLINAYDYIRLEAIWDYSPVSIDDEDYTNRDYLNVLIGRWNTKEMKNKLKTFEKNYLKKSINNNNEVTISKSIIIDDDSDIKINKNKVIRIDNNNKSDEFNEIISDFLKELSKQLIIKKVDIKYSD